MAALPVRANDLRASATLYIDGLFHPQQGDTARDLFGGIGASADLDYRPHPAWRLRAVPRFYLDARDSELHRYLPHEASVAFSAGPMDLTVGLLRFDWGISEALRPTDTLNPIDYGQGLLRTEKLAEFATELRFTVEPWSLDLVVIPFHQPPRFPTDSASLGLALGGFTALGLDFDPDWRTPESVEDVTFAARTRVTLGPVDLAASWMRGPSRLPGPWLDDVVLRAKDFPVDVVGGSLSWVVGPVVIRGEAAWVYTGRAPDFRVEENPYPWARPIPPSHTTYVGGLEANFWDVTGDHDLTVVLEYVGEARPYHDAQAALRPLQGDVYAALRWSMDDLDDTRVGLSALVDVKRGDSVLRLSAERRLVSELVLRLDAALVIPGDDGPLSVLHNLGDADVISARLSWTF
ncbi:MAG: hypothetical protein IV100_33370 [Myxococcales bacterium]|nr:hypothetical protein [Myxococcales bacterium]